MRRRLFIGLLGGTAAAWPFAARAQQGDRMRRIGMFMSVSESDPQGQAFYAAFLQGLQQFGWTDGRKARIHTRWGAANTDRLRNYAAELVALGPDVILASGGSTVRALLQATRTVPIVFAHAFDPIGGGYVDSLAKPGGNVTGFSATDFDMGAKWLELLKQIAPGVTRVAVIREANPSGIGALAVMQSVAPSLRVGLTAVSLRDAGELERALTAFARQPNGGLILTPSALAFVHRDLVVTLAARHRMPAVSYFRDFVAAGGLVSYGADGLDLHRRAGGYADRILKGEKPADMPVQAPTKFDLVVNLKTAKALDLAVPDTLLVAATEVIE